MNIGGEVTKTETARKAAPQTSGVYAIRNRLNGAIYVGSAVNIAKRWNIHKFQLARGAHHSFRLQQAWDAEACPDIFEFAVLEHVAIGDLLSAEQFWIDFYRAADPVLGYNIEPKAGSSMGRACRAPTRGYEYLGQPLDTKPFHMRRSRVSEIAE